MIIQCTKKLLAYLDIQPQEKTEPVNDPMFSWHANLIEVYHQYVMVMMNDASRYVVSIAVDADYDFLEVALKQSIREALLDECIDEALVDKYLASSGTIIFSKATNRSFLAQMNYSCNDVAFYSSLLNFEKVNQLVNSRHVNNDTVRFKDVYISPKLRLVKCFEEAYQVPIYRCLALELRIKLMLNNFDVWRRIIVPMNFTFSDLHSIIQTIFDWKARLAHDFYVINDNIVIAKIGSNTPYSHTETFIYEDSAPFFYDDETPLSDFLPKYKVIYSYDNNNDWIHDIICESVIVNYNDSQSVCTTAVGPRPPENVGGEINYENYLKILNDPTHDDYERMKIWSETMKPEKYDIDQVNRKLRQIRV
jgi:hypothetical protein